MIIIHMTNFLVSKRRELILEIFFVLFVHVYTIIWVESLLGSLTSRVVFDSKWDVAIFFFLFSKMFYCQLLYFRSGNTN